MVEGVDRIAWFDLDVKAHVGGDVANGKLHSVGLGVPEKENLDRPALP